MWTTAGRGELCRSKEGTHKGCPYVYLEADRFDPGWANPNVVPYVYLEPEGAVEWGATTRVGAYGGEPVVGPGRSMAEATGVKMGSSSRQGLRQGCRLW